MASYDDKTLDRIPPDLSPGEQEHVLIMQDESIFHTNEYRQRIWLAQGQQPLWKKGHGHAIHVSDFICETIGRLKLSESQIEDQSKLPADDRLPAFEARKIIYPGKGFDAWWDLPQLINQIKLAISIFDVTHPHCIAVFTFDRSSAHEGFAENALNVNNMNIGPGGNQRRLRDTIIPFSNPDPAPGEEDTHGQVQHMCYSEDHADPKLKGKPKGMRVVLQERKSIWDKLSALYLKRTGKTNVVGRCASCSKSQLHKDADRRAVLAESTAHEDNTAMDDARNGPETSSTPDNDWCCIYRVLSQQEDFCSEKPLIQTVIEGAGHICLFLPRFHCELNPIEMLWGYGKYSMHRSDTYHICDAFHLLTVNYRVQEPNRW